LSRFAFDDNGASSSKEESESLSFFAFGFTFDDEFFGLP
jgi:hypothetical protein